AAGFDKNAAHVHALAALGFAFIAVGSVTARPAEGNPRPRLFRLPQDAALINRMGLNNEGAQAVAARIEGLRAAGPLPVPLFINVAKTHDAALCGDAAIADYAEAVGRLQGLADAVVINISCPNSGDGRTFEDPALLAPLLAALRPLVDVDRPLLVKLSPDLPDATLDAVIDTALDAGVTGFTATNTSVDRSRLITPPRELEQIGAGGLSGAPLVERSRQVVAHVRRRIGPDRPIVGVGGVRTGADAAALRAAGADLVQLYTGFIYGGPTTVKRLVAAL
ncbi:MAG: quinone-dependent dihydroorotate dehydrogenase, partial [Myxococcales bacterium]|nr:quinone-dependent dihydroorotate dehydrogenase [Myxococcales bacterium]